MSSFADSIVKDIDARFRVDVEDLDAYADIDEAAHIRKASDLRDDVWEHMHLEPSQIGGLMPWDSSHKDWQIRPGELSVWTGKRGEGKSLLISHIIQSLLQQDQRAVIASMEMPLLDTMQRIERQALGVDNPGKKYHDTYYDWLENRLWLYEQGDAVPERSIRGLCRYAISELGVHHVVIDSLMMVKFSARNSWEKLEQQADFCRSLASIAKSTGAHIHLVAHMRKSDGKTRASADDVKGGGDITDLASCVWMIEANLKKRDESIKRVKNEEIMAGPDIWLRNEKNRRGITGNRLSLWLHEKSLQFIARNSPSAMMMAQPFLEKMNGGQCFHQNQNSSSEN